MSAILSSGNWSGDDGNFTLFGREIEVYFLNSSLDSLDAGLPKIYMALWHIKLPVAPSTSISHHSAYNIKSATLPLHSPTAFYRHFI